MTAKQLCNPEVVPPVIKWPKPKLKAGTIYSGDNGRLICLHCAGRSAKFTGRDLSGHRVTALGQDDALEWEAHFGESMSCERGCTTYRSIKAASPT